MLGGQISKDLLESARGFAEPIISQYEIAPLPNTLFSCGITLEMLQRPRSLSDRLIGEIYNAQRDLDETMTRVINSDFINSYAAAKNKSTMRSITRNCEEINRTACRQFKAEAADLQKASTPFDDHNQLRDKEVGASGTLAESVEQAGQRDQCNNNHNVFKGYLKISDKRRVACFGLRLTYFHEDLRYFNEYIASKNIRCDIVIAVEGGGNADFEWMSLHNAHIVGLCLGPEAKGSEEPNESFEEFTRRALEARFSINKKSTRGRKLKYPGLLRLIEDMSAEKGSTLDHAEVLRQYKNKTKDANLPIPCLNTVKRYFKIIFGDQE